MDRDQLDCVFSAVMRSWIECAVGGVEGERGGRGKPQEESVAPWERRSCDFTMSVVERASVIVCSTWRRGFTSRK